jgi:hypothetical protein
MEVEQRFQSPRQQRNPNLRGLLELILNCTKEALAGELEIWTQIKETSDFADLRNQEMEEAISEETFIASLPKVDSK